MIYRELGKTGLKVSALSLGCMRLSENDLEMAEMVVDKAIEFGVNYFETTRGYIGGKCQHLTALGLKKRSRGLIVSGKAGIGEDTTADSYRKEIDLQMEIFGVDYLEFFQVGWMSLDRMDMLTKKGGALEALRKAQDEKIIGHIGFTGHDLPENFTKMIETGIFDSMTIPYNLANRSYASTIKRAGELGVGVVAMCPVAGGMLSAPTKQLETFMDDATTTSTAAALRYVLSNPSVSTACSGMQNMTQLLENVDTVNNTDILSPEEYAKAEKILDDFKVLGDKFCTKCGYCVPCPQDIYIPGVFEVYNMAQLYGNYEWAKKMYKMHRFDEKIPTCIECAECEGKCPNKMDIIEKLKMVHAELS